LQKSRKRSHVIPQVCGHYLNRSELSVQNFAGLSLTEAAARGDLNGGFRNDHRDFVLFKTAFEVTSGLGSFAGMPGVPEPAVSAMAFKAFLAVIRRCGP
jgi:hypothetical protein